MSRSNTQRAALRAMIAGPLQCFHFGWTHPKRHPSAWTTRTIAALHREGLLEIRQRRPLHFVAKLTAAGRSEARRG